MSNKPELELKHILPYLPHELIVKDFGVLLSLSKSNNDAMFDYAANDGIEVTKGYVESLVPLLRPMSDLFEPVGDGIGGTFSVANLICDKQSDLKLTEDENGSYIWKDWADELLDFTEPQDLPHWITEILNEYHFDWHYNLIEKGLAEPIKNK
jgi:hypothetical protein